MFVRGFHTTAKNIGGDMNADLVLILKIGFLGIVWSGVGIFFVWYYLTQGRHNMREARERKKRHDEQRLLVTQYKRREQSNRQELG